MADRVDDAMEMLVEDTGVNTDTAWHIIDDLAVHDGFGVEFLFDVLRYFSGSQLMLAVRNAVDNHYIDDDRHYEYDKRDYEEGEDETE